MMGPTWIMPVELVRASANAVGVARLAQLAARHAELKPHAPVEIGPAGFVATVHYTLPAYVAREEQVHISLVAPPQENRL